MSVSPLRLLGYLWNEAEIEFAAGPFQGGKIRHLFREDDELAIDIESALSQEDVEPCWFCHREVPADSLIAGYDTFEESRLACNTCNDAIQWLNAHGLTVSRQAIPA